MKLFHSNYNPDPIDFDTLNLTECIEIIRKYVISDYDLTDQTIELKIIKSRLEKINKRFYELFDNLHMASVIIEHRDDNFIMLQFNKKSRELDKLTDDAIGKSLKEIYPSIEDFHILKVFKRVSETGIPEKHTGKYIYDGTIQHPDIGLDIVLSEVKCEVDCNTQIH